MDIASSHNCLRCGKCCSNYLPLSDKELRVLRDVVKKNNIKPIKQLTIKNWYDICPFLDGNTCTIYNIRPLICSSYTCSRMLYKDFSGMDELLKEKRPPRNLRKEVFK